MGWRMVRPSGSIDSRPASSRASISSAEMRRPPIATSTPATLLTRPPAEKPTKTWSIWVPAMRSACSTASRIAISLFSMSAMKPRLTPRLSRWPVPRMRSLPSSGSAIRAQTLDEPTSSAATRLRTGIVGARRPIICSAPSDRPRKVGRGGSRIRGRRGRDDRAWLARDTDIGAPWIAHVDAGEAAAEQGILLVHHREAGDRAAGLVVALRQGQQFAALEAYVPAALPPPGRAGDRRPKPRRRLEQLAEPADMAVGVGADHQRQVRHMID